CQKYNTSPLSF
nr:immunoglobulin light chain junction region [Macaca mulatta]MOW11790.1 immunoglobulin light chain junction region [Macaca mulatta]MOW13607.1 immunoglobulin light chain junction region [Macaca mulatta]MOW13705.1 immunoglobulin light chain junction region [Macaca mulatta]MOW13875.1 immunoglobulin light chain junction region [Macaca mulatta]